MTEFLMRSAFRDRVDFGITKRKTLIKKEKTFSVMLLTEHSR